MVALALAALSLASGAHCSYEEIDPPAGYALVGDYCAVDGTYACDEAVSPSAAELVCVDNRFTESRPCAGGCRIVSAQDLLPDGMTQLDAFESDGEVAAGDSLSSSNTGSPRGGSSTSTVPDSQTPLLLCDP